MKQEIQFKDTFCPSPWFHMRINNDGYYEYCRWEDKRYRNQYNNITNIEPRDFFVNHMANFRMSMLNGKQNKICSDCFNMEQHDKVSGRQKQLIKIGVDYNNFEKSLLSSNWISHFKYSNTNNGLTTADVIDWQIDLGNYCNSGCLYCTPFNSSLLANEWKKIGLIDKLPNNSWCDDLANVEKFTSYLCSLSKIYYLHFIGGETLLTPAFKIILTQLINSGLHTQITIGFTTNLTVWDDEINEMLVQFKQVNLGVSIEALHKINDYIRWPSKISNVKQILDKWVKLGKSQTWLIQIRTTPTILSMIHLDTIYKYAIEHNVGIESCNFLHKPEYMRISVLPLTYRNIIINKMQKIVDDNVIDNSYKIINTRNPSNIHTQIIQDISSYISYLENEEDESHRLPSLVEYLKLMESSRNNSILEYLPEYEDIFRTAGY